MRCCSLRSRPGTRGGPGRIEMSFQPLRPPARRPATRPRRPEEQAMDLTPYIGWILFLHVGGAFVFAAGHGVSIYMAFQVRRERDPARIAALLDLSAASLVAATVGLLLLLVAGIVAGAELRSLL